MKLKLFYATHIRSHLPIHGCNKSGTVKVTVKTILNGPEHPAQGDIVAVQNLPDCHEIEGATVPSSGIVIFDDLKAGSYRVVAMHYDSANTLAGEAYEGIALKKGETEEVELVIE